MLQVLTLALVASALPSSSYACTIVPVGVTPWELVESYPEPGGVVPADKDVVLVFAEAQGSNTHNPWMSHPPQQFSIWDVNGPEQVVLQTSIQIVKAEVDLEGGAWPPAEIHECHAQFSDPWRRFTVVRRLCPDAGWEPGHAYEIRFETADVVGLEDYEDDPGWFVETFAFTAGPATGSPSALPTLAVDRVAESGVCHEDCHMGIDCEFWCTGQGYMTQLFSVTSSPLKIDLTMGAVVLDLQTSGGVADPPYWGAGRHTFLLMPGASYDIDLQVHRCDRGSIERKETCTACLHATLESPGGELLVDAGDQCFDVYQEPSPPDPCQDWTEEWLDGDVITTPLSWPTCGAQAPDTASPDADTSPDDAGPTDGAQKEVGGSGRFVSCSASSAGGSVWPCLMLLGMLMVFRREVRR
ncbi:MAG: hypothetical protein ABIK09_03970 [Pseudomonadota bacterium]